MLQMIEQLQTLSRMREYHLYMESTGQFSLSALNAACDRIERCGLADCLSDRRLPIRIHQELIRNTGFADYLRELMSNKISPFTVDTWLDSADRFDEDMTQRYSPQQLVQLSACGIRSVEAQYECLKYFAEGLTDDSRQPTLVTNLNTFFMQETHRLSDLTDEQRGVLYLHGFSEHIRISSKTIQSVLTMLASSAPLCNLISLLQQQGVDRTLEAADLANLSYLGEAELALLQQCFEKLAPGMEDMELFLDRWLENHAPRYDLEWFARHTSAFTDEEKRCILHTRIGYLNALYAGQLDIPFEAISPCQHDVLIYAIAHRKKHFLRLVTEHFEVFSNLGWESPLVHPAFYHRCNLNSLTATDLRACTGKAGKTCRLDLLEEREYTARELILLSYADEAYVSFYNRLSGIGIDRRIIVMRELLKHNLLSCGLAEDQLQELARHLSEKPLSAWRERELAHIAGLSAQDAIRILLVYDKVQRFLPDIHTWEEALFISRNAERSQDYETWAQVQDDILHADHDWAELAAKLEISDVFIEAHRQDIIHFLMREGAEMSNQYYGDTDYKDAFRRILLAEMMGEFRTLKYHPGDLEKEISYPMTPQQQKVWQENTSLDLGKFHVEEMDDFYTTLRIGTLPYETCLSYRKGAHRDCLLAGFDSNKKFLLARKGDQVVGRAAVRLTKGRFLPPDDKKAGPSLEFADLTKVSDLGESQAAAEYLTVFLEIPYFCQVNETEQETIERMFVSLIAEKALNMNAAPVLPLSYAGACPKDMYIRSNYYLYISKSKGGNQYLDSLSGPASVSAEGSFKSYQFLVRQELPDSGAPQH